MLWLNDLLFEPTIFGKLEIGETYCVCMKNTKQWLIWYCMLWGFLGVVFWIGFNWDFLEHWALGSCLGWHFQENFETSWTFFYTCRKKNSTKIWSVLEKRTNISFVNLYSLFAIFQFGLTCVFFISTQYVKVIYYTVFWSQHPYWIKDNWYFKRKM